MNKAARQIEQVAREMNRAHGISLPQCRDMVRTGQFGQTPMKPINQQTPGPLHWQGTLAKPHALVYLCNPDDTQVVCAEYGTTKPDAALLAAAYTAYDRAARELGVDAVELAESIDLAAMIGCLTDTVNGIETAPEWATALLSKLPAKR